MSTTVHYLIRWDQIMVHIGTAHVITGLMDPIVQISRDIGLVITLFSLPGAGHARDVIRTLHLGDRINAC